MADIGELPPIESEIKGPVRPITDVLMDARKDTNKAVPDELQRIDMSILNPHLNELWARTYADPRHREFGKAVYVSPTDRLRVSTETMIGNDKGTQVEITVPPSLRDKFVLAIHTHPNDHALSVADLSHLFYPTVTDGDGPSVGEMVLTDSQTSLIMRGQSTPQWEVAYAKEQLSKWKDEEDRRIKSAFLQADKASSSGRRYSPDGYGSELTGSKLGHEAAVLAQAAYISEIAQEYDLRWFNGVPGAKYVTLPAA